MISLIPVHDIHDENNKYNRRLFSKGFHYMVEDSTRDCYIVTDNGGIRNFISKNGEYLKDNFTVEETH